MTDAAPSLPQPPGGLGRLAWFIGEVARPFAIIWTALCAGIATLMLAAKITDPVQAGVFIGVVYTAGVAPLFLGKAWETWKSNRAAADVEIARSTAPAAEQTNAVRP